MVQDRSTTIISMITWIRTSRLSTKNSLAHDPQPPNPAAAGTNFGNAGRSHEIRTVCCPPATLKTTQGQTYGFFSQLPFKCHLPEVRSVGD